MTPLYLDSLGPGIDGAGSDKLVDDDEVGAVAVALVAELTPPLIRLKSPGSMYVL